VADGAVRANQVITDLFPTRSNREIYLDNRVGLAREIRLLIVSDETLNRENCSGTRQWFANAGTRRLVVEEIALGVKADATGMLA
jgi:hypothetical protein